MAGFNLCVAHPYASESTAVYSSNRIQRKPDASEASASSASSSTATIAATVAAVAPESTEVSPGSTADELRTAHAWELGGDIHCVSNSSMDDASWPKIEWLTRQAATAVAGLVGSDAKASTSTTDAATTVDGLDTVGALLRRLLPLMLATSVTTSAWESSVSDSDLEWSMAPRDIELRLQRGPLVAAAPGYPSYLTTRTLSVAVHTDAHAIFASKDIEALQRTAAGEAPTGKPDTGKPDRGKPDTGKPDTGKPDTGKPDTAAAGASGQESEAWTEGIQDIGEELSAAIGGAWPSPEEASLSIAEAVGRSEEPIAAYGTAPSEAAAPTSKRGQTMLEHAWAQPWQAVRVATRQ
jgi:hypothetical protein